MTIIGSLARFCFDPPIRNTIGDVLCAREYIIQNQLSLWCPEVDRANEPNSAAVVEERVLK